MSRVLIIEDNDMHLELASELLDKDGYHIIKAENAALGIEKAIRQNPDLILMDMDLPNMDGYQATKLLKNESQTQSIPVVALTALVMKDDIKKAFDSGCSGFIAKPIDINTFSHSVKNYLKTDFYKENVDEVSNKIYENAYTRQIKTQAKQFYKPTLIDKTHKILIVDDNPMNAELLKGIVEQLGKNTEIAFSGKEAIASVRQEKFDLILLDIMMPEISGYEVFEQIKQMPKNKYTPVLFVSALNETKDIIKGLGLGSFGYVTKPFNIDELKARILNVLSIKDLQDTIRHEKDKFDNINKFSADGIITLDADLKFVSCSNQFLQWTNSSKEEIMGKDFLSVIKQFVKEPDTLLDKMLSVQNYCLNLEVEQNEKILEVSCSTIYGVDNEVDGYVFIMRDVTEHKEIESQKETFIATLTHDLKTPIRAEIRSLELLLNGSFGELAPQQDELIREILYSSKFMFTMVDTLLSKYKYENGKICLNKIHFDINELIKECHSEIKYLSEEKKQKIALVFENEKQEVFADSLEIKRLLMNFFSNAINYTQNEGKIEIKSRICGDFLEISFKDNGRGISKDKIATLFNKYVSYATKFRQVGTGLGLYVSKMIAEAHKGSIAVESEEGTGSVFSFKLPLN